MILFLFAWEPVLPETQAVIIDTTSDSEVFVIYVSTPFRISTSLSTLDSLTSKVTEACLMQNALNKFYSPLNKSQDGIFCQS